MPRAILFDLDDTLFDHHTASTNALARVHAASPAGRRATFEAFQRHHTRFLEEMHIEVLAGRVGLDDARRERFRRVFAALGVDVTVEETAAAAAAYRAGYLEARRPTAGAVDLVAALKPRVRIGIVSNNLLEEQREKLEICGLAPYVDSLVVSEEVGLSKPDPGIFRTALARLGAREDSAIMVGDSWQADIAGAAAAGIRPVWFNPRRLPRPSDDPQGFADVEELHALTPADDVSARLLRLLEPVSAAGEPGRARRD
jgi:HAD superfamily hydrolase (TIGR01549 family)